MARVLIVDDSEPDRLYVRALLKKNGYDVIEAGDGTEALERVKERPDVILLDVVMPVMDGFSTLAALQADAEAAYIPVLLMTARDSGDDAAKGLRSGAHDFLHKPVDPTDLVARVGAAARVAGLYTQLRSRNADLETFGHLLAHDLKSPLSVVRSYAEILAGAIGPMTEEKKLEVADKIIAAADRGVGLVEDILVLAKQEMDAGSGTCSDPAAVLHRVIASIEPSDSEIDVCGTWEPLSISDPAFEAVVRNLVENSSHYGRSSDGRLRLAVCSEPGEGRARITVEDQGSGVDPADAEWLFEPFRRGEGAKEMNPRSTGVGLAIVRRAAERWGGAVTVERGSTGGARFVVTLRTPSATG